ncbi:MAG: hypothetical protein WC608_04735 [Parcubacteria group bacterium]
MDKKITTGAGTVIFIIIAVTAFYFIQKAKEVSTPSEPTPTSVQTSSKSSQQGTTTQPADANTIEGMILSIGEKDIAIGNGTSEPDLISISGSTPVVKLKKDQTEIPAGLSSVIPGVKVKVTYKTNAETQLKVAEKIYILEK